jgi:hypothetical protein
MLDLLAPRVFDTIRPGTHRPRDPRIHLAEDLRNVRAGILDPRGFVSGYLPQRHSVELVIRSAEGQLRAIRRSHNLRVTQGRDSWQRILMFGDITANATSYTGASGAATATSATSLTNSGAVFPTSGGGGVGGLVGHTVVSMAAGVPAVYGTIMSNTATVLTIDQWTSVSSATGAAGTTPTATAEYWVMPGPAFALWIGLSTSTAAAAAGDVLRSADGLFADGTTGAAATEQNASGLVRTYVPPTFPSPGNIQLQNTWTYTSSGAITLGKVVLCNSKPVVGSLLILETLLSATATVTANGDTVQVTWTVTL